MDRNEKKREYLIEKTQLVYQYKFDRCTFDANQTFAAPFPRILITQHATDVNQQAK